MWARISNRILGLMFFTILTLTVSPNTLLADGYPSYIPRAVTEEVYNDLSRLGAWITIERYGMAWVPYGVSPDWRPYTVGHWFYNDEYGWTWASNESWGAVTYHYGRWFYDILHGWCWVPDKVWAPAWVAWRSGDAWIGWAPLPPLAAFAPGVGIVSVFDVDDLFPSHSFCFVHRKFFDADNIQLFIEPAVKNMGIVQNTYFINNLATFNNININRGPEPRQVTQWTGHAVVMARLTSISKIRRQVEQGAVRITQPASGPTHIIRGNSDEMRARLNPNALEESNPSHSLSEQHRQQMKDLFRFHEQVKVNLQKSHEFELKGDSPRESLDEIPARHNMEVRELEDQSRRQQQVLSHWQLHEREDHIASSHPSGGARFSIPSDVSQEGNLVIQSSHAATPGTPRH